MSSRVSDFWTLAQEVKLQLYARGRPVWSVLMVVQMKFEVLLLMHSEGFARGLVQALKAAAVVFPR